MAEDTGTEEEPSIEEILDSIRQIISEDEDESDDSGKEEPPEEKQEEEPVKPAGMLGQDAVDAIDFDEAVPVEDDPLDQSAIDDIDFDTPEPEPEPEEEEEVIELTEKVEDDIDIDMIEEEPEPEDTDALLTENAENAAVSAIEELARKTTVEHSGITLEEIVRSELKPLLTNWLDKNLPKLIERLVQEELERVSKRVLDD